MYIRKDVPSSFKRKSKRVGDGWVVWQLSATEGQKHLKKWSGKCEGFGQMEASNGAAISGIGESQLNAKGQGPSTYMLASSLDCNGIRQLYSS